MKNRILVTGGTGYIGSHTVVELINAGYEPLIIDNLSNSNIGVLDGIKKITNKNIIFENVDCQDYSNLNYFFDKYRDVKAIIHFAASKAVGESVEKPLLYYRNNLISLINLLELMPKHGVENFVFSSSCTVYGQPDELPVTEQSPIKPAISPYGSTKQMSETIVTDTARAFPKMKAVLLRYFNPIGAHLSGEIGELPNGIPNNLLPFVTQTAIGIREKLRVFGNDYNTDDGSCIRDYIHVTDLARAHVAAVDRMLQEKGEKGVEIFNLGTGAGLSVLEVIRTFEEVTGVKVPYEIAPRREGDIEKVWADASHANQVLGWKAEKTVKETLRSAWYWELKLRERREME